MVEKKKKQIEKSENLKREDTRGKKRDDQYATKPLRGSAVERG